MQYFNLSQKENEQTDPQRILTCLFYQKELIQQTVTDRHVSAAL